MSSDLLDLMEEFGVSMEDVLNSSGEVDIDVFTAECGLNL